MSLADQIRYYTRIALIIFVVVVALFGSGSQLINNYERVTSETSADDDEDEIVEITYNEDIVNDITGGYTGAPTLVKGDDKVFYIPGEYCDGSYLKNFRVIGMNLSGMKQTNISTNAGGDIEDYSGVVILYGFQTTYKADYGSYDFGYEPYDYDVEYEVVDSFFEDLINGSANTEEYLPDSDGTSLWESVGEGKTIKSVITNDVEFEENGDVVDDSEFKVATIVMEHEIGKDECKILYCDADSAKLSEVENGEYNLVTNLTDDCLTVCYNEQMYIYSFDEKNATYATNDVYYYKISDLFASSTFKNSMAEAGYCAVEYTVTGDITFDTSGTNWVNNWLGCVNTQKVVDGITDVTYLSNVTTENVKKSEIHNGFVDMEAYLQEALDNAYKGYQKTSSGLLSYNHTVTINSYDDTYTYKRDAQNNKSWVLTCKFTATLQEKSWLIIFSKTYKSSISGSITISIVPEYTYKSAYSYTIDDLLMTKYDSTSTAKKYSMIMQMMVTPTSTSTSSEYEEVEPITEDLNSWIGNDEDTVPDGLSEDSLSEEGDEVYDSGEEDIKSALSTKYLTFNINLAQEEGSTTMASTKVQTIENANELKEYIEKAEADYQAARDAGIQSFANENKSGPYVIPKDFTIDSINDFKSQSAAIVELRKEIATLEAELAEKESEVTSEYAVKADNAAEVNSIADTLTGDDAISDTSSKGVMGYYAELEDKLSQVFDSAIVNEDGTITLTPLTTTKINTFLSNCVSNANYFLNTCPRDASSVGEISGYYVYTYTGTDYKSDLANAKTACDKISVSSFNSELKALNTIITSISSVSVTDSTLSDIAAAGQLDTIRDTYESLKTIVEFSGKLSYGYINSLFSRSTPSWSTYKTNMTNYYDNMKDELAAVYNFANNLDVFFTANSSGTSIMSYVFQMSTLLSAINTGEGEIADLEAQIALLEAQLQVLKDNFDSTVFSVKFYWDNNEITADYLDANYTQYEAMIKNLDQYLSAYNSLYKVDAYRTSADTVVSYIETLNTDYDINRIIDSMNDAVNMASEGSETAEFTNDVKYLYRYKNRFYRNISASLNSAANLYTAETEDNSDYAEEDENINIQLIKVKIDIYYGSIGENALRTRTYDEIIKECQSIYDSLYDSFSKITTKDENGTEIEVCDVTVDTVYKYVCNYLIDEYTITALTYKDDNDTEVTTSIAKSAESSGNMTASDGTTESTTASPTSSDGYNQNLYAVYGSQSAMALYADNMYEIYKNISDLAFTLFYDSGVLTDEQQATVTNSGSNYSEEELSGGASASESSEANAGIDAQIINRDSDLTSDYNLGYVPAYKICMEMPELLSEVKTYYETRQSAAIAINEAAAGSMSLVLNDAEYYEQLYYTQYTQCEYLYTLLYNAAKFEIDSDARNEVIAEFNSYDWIISEALNADDDLSSMLVISTSELTTTYRKVIWNTSLIDTEVDEKITSIVTDEPYEIYPMKSNFAVVVNSDRGYVVPMGIQADAVVKGVNQKLKDEMKSFGMITVTNGEASGEIDNVAYGYDDSSGYDILFFSSSSLGKWYIITFTETKMKDSNGDTYISLSEKQVTGYKGTFDASYEKKATETSETDSDTSSSSTDSSTEVNTEDGGSTSEDSHFLEYSHTLVTGLNQLYSATIENGFIPYKIKLVSNGTGDLTPEVTFIQSDADMPVTEFEDGSSGVEGAFFNAWNFTSGSKGYVALLGYTKEDMQVETETTTVSDTVTDSATEATTAFSSSAAAEAAAEAAEESDEETEETTEAIEYREITDEDIYKAHVYVYAFDTKSTEVEKSSGSSLNESYYGFDSAMLSDLLAELTGPYGELVTTPVILLEYARVPLLVLAYAILALIAIRVGVNYAKADDDEKRQKAKEHIKWYIIAVLGIHIVMGSLYCGYRQLKAWQEDIAIETKTDSTYYHDDDYTTTETTTKKDDD
ncbi:MAG: hypothetical protein LUG66_02630 [Clostridiales bacterium]|nr:hypothetical protein [Clostridiales bacterium]